MMLHFGLAFRPTNKEMRFNQTITRSKRLFSYIFVTNLDIISNERWSGKMMNMRNELNAIKCIRSKISKQKLKLYKNISISSAAQSHCRKQTFTIRSRYEHNRFCFQMIFIPIHSIASWPQRAHIRPAFF